jgi:hypothetical protein
MEVLAQVLQEGLCVSSVDSHGRWSEAYNLQEVTIYKMFAPLWLVLEWTVELVVEFDTVVDVERRIAVWLHFQLVHVPKELSATSVYVSKVHHAVLSFLQVALDDLIGHLAVLEHLSSSFSIVIYQKHFCHLWRWKTIQGLEGNYF